jgi:hypothetical protein
MTAKNYRIRISRAGQEFEAEGDKTFVLQMLERFEGPIVIETKNPSSKKTSEGKEKSLANKVKAVSIREFVQQLGFKKHTDITLAFGYYLERQADTAEFTPADINNCYYEAKIETSNTSQMIVQNIRRGHIMLAKTKEKGKKRYTLTTSGEKYIEERLGGS